MTVHLASRRRTARFALLAAALAFLPMAWSLAVGSAVDAGGPNDLLPDLSMTKPTSLRVATTSGGARRLQFTGTIVNIGKGPFETRASRRSTSVPTMSVSQRIYNTAGGTRVHAGTAVARYAGDGHNHWHVQQVANYGLYSPTGTGPVLRRDAKVGFCFFDTNPYKLSLPGAPGSRQYQQSGCGTKSSLFAKNGLSVGWSDVYPWNFAFQWIDVTGLPAGEYLLKVSADPEGQFEELVEGNNCNWTRIRIPKSGSTVRVVESGGGCALPVRVEPIPTGRVVVPPRPAVDAPVDADLSSTGAPVSFICPVPGMSPDLAALPAGGLGLGDPRG